MMMTETYRAVRHAIAPLAAVLMLGMPDTLIESVVVLAAYGISVVLSKMRDTEAAE